MNDHDKYATAVFQNLNNYMESVFKKIEAEQPEMLQKMEYVLNTEDCDLVAQINLGTDCKHIRIFIETGFEQLEVANIKYKTSSKH